MAQMARFAGAPTTPNVAGYFLNVINFNNNFCNGSIRWQFRRFDRQRNPQPEFIFAIISIHSCSKWDFSFSTLASKIQSANRPLALTLDDTGHKGITTRSICDRLSYQTNLWSKNSITTECFSGIFSKMQSDSFVSSSLGGLTHT